MAGILGNGTMWAWEGNTKATLRNLRWQQPVEITGDAYGLDELYSWLVERRPKSEDEELIEALRDEIDEKDEQIITLQERVETLEDEIEALRARLVEMEGDE